MSHSRGTNPPLLKAIAPAVTGLTRLIHRLEITGAKNIPDEPAIFIANHSCHLDALILPTALWRVGIIPRFAVKKELFRGPLASFLRAAGQIRVDRDRPEGVIDQLGEVLDEGVSLTVFPEGTFTRDPGGWPMRCKTGFARIAAAHHVPVVPVAMWGAQRVLDVQHSTLHARTALSRARILVDFGEPFTVSGAPREAADQAAMTLIEQVASLRRRFGEEAEPPRQPWRGDNWPSGRWRIAWD